MTSALWALYRRDLTLSLRVGGGAAVSVLFFLVVVTIVPLGVGPDLKLLARIGPGILWIGALLATLLGLERLFQADRDDGSLDLLLTGEAPLSLVVLAKAAAHWTASGLPLVVAAPFLALFLDLSPTAIGAVTLTLAAGTPALTLMGAIGAALTAGLRRGGLLVPVLVVPLAVPVLIFGVAAADAAVTDPAPFLPPFLILCALTLFSLVIAPIAAAAALRAGEG
jgi:heme exporter protein B